MIKNVVENIEKNFLTRRIFQDKSFRTFMFTGFSTCINLAYVCYNGFLGIAKHSVWFFTMFVYYGILCIMRANAVHKSRKNDRSKDGLVMFADGILLIFLALVLSGIVFLSLRFNLMKSYGKITMITLTTYTFYKLTISIINLKKSLKTNHKIIKTIRNINFADALVSLISTQMSMYATFSQKGDGHTMTILTSAGVCSIICFIAVKMIISSKKP